MPRKSAQKSTEEKQASAPAPVAQQAAEPAVPKRKGGKKAAPAEVSVPVESTSTEPAVKKVRVLPTRDSVQAEFDTLISSIESEIKNLRDSSVKTKGVKFLRSVNKQVKTLKAHALRISKRRDPSRRNNTNSGFLKPVQISKDLAKFTGWSQSEPRSRVDVTKYICNYIKEHNLQDTNDKRIISVDQDNNLRQLLQFDPKTSLDKEGKPAPLTYYRLQTYLKKHFSPLEGGQTVPVAPAKAAPAKAVATPAAAPAPVAAEASAEAQPKKNKKNKQQAVASH